MYKFFLCFRYLTRKGIVIFPILVVWLCVMMMIIVASIMGGFVDRVREANRGLMGDIIIDSHMGSGWPYYQDLQQELQKKVPEIELSTPVVHAYGLFSVPGGNTFAQVIGIWPEQRAKISNFKQSLYLQDTAPRKAVDELSRGGFPATTEQLLRRAAENANATQKRLEQIEEYGDTVLHLGTLDLDTVIHKNRGQGREIWLLAGIVAVMSIAPFILVFLHPRLRKLYVVAGLGLLVGSAVLTVFGFITYRAFDRFNDRRNDLFAQMESGYTTASLLEALPHGKTYTSRTELADDLIPREPSFKIPPDATEPGTATPPDGCIIGVDLGLIPRDRRGNYDRSRFHFPHADITVVPVSVHGSVLVGQAREHSFVVVDDSYTKVYDVDSTYVYVPFDIAQNMAGMSGLTDENGNNLPSRCTEVQIKVRGADDPDTLLAVRQKIQNVIEEDFAPNHADLPQLYVQTWDQKQARYIGAVKNEKTIIIFILGLMSGVVLVVIFLIFWMIVRDKTRDIGIIKALGGSEEGVAAIFLFYGLFIGTVGGVLGGFTGTLFVRNTNWIHDSVLYDIFGLTIWDRSVYLFDRIPDRVNPWEVGIYVLAAILAGAIGALIPAIFAGLQDPVNAVRYE